MLNSPCPFCVYFDIHIPGTLQILLVSKKSTLSSDRPTRSGKARHLSQWLIFPKLSSQTMHGSRREFYPQFTLSPLVTLGPWLSFWRAHTKKRKKKEEFFASLDSRWGCLFQKWNWSFLNVCSLLLQPGLFVEPGKGYVTRDSKRNYFHFWNLLENAVLRWLNRFWLISCPGHFGLWETLKGRTDVCYGCKKGNRTSI